MRAPKISAGCVKEQFATAGTTMNQAAASSLAELMRHILVKLDALIELTDKMQDEATEKKALRLRDVLGMTGISRSQIYAMADTKNVAYDPTWPKSFSIGKSRRWLMHEVQSWIEAQASATRVKH